MGGGPRSPYRGISTGEWLVEWLVELAGANGWNLAAAGLGGVVECQVGLLAPDCPETAVWQAELRPRQLLYSRYDQCVVGKSRVRA